MACWAYRRFYWLINRRLLIWIFYECDGCHLHGPLMLSQASITELLTFHLQCGYLSDISCGDVSDVWKGRNLSLSLVCRIVAEISKQTALVEFTSVVNVISFPFFFSSVFCQEVRIISKDSAGGSWLVGVPVTRSLSGPITVWSPSAVNSMSPLLELMSSFRVCPWASFGPATTRTTTITPAGVWQYYREKNEIREIYTFSFVHCSNPMYQENITRHIYASLCENLTEV